MKKNVIKEKIDQFETGISILSTHSPLGRDIKNDTESLLVNHHPNDYWDRAAEELVYLDEYQYLGALAKILVAISENCGNLSENNYIFQFLLLIPIMNENSAVTFDPFSMLSAEQRALLASILEGLACLGKASAEKNSLSPDDFFVRELSNLNRLLQ